MKQSDLRALIRECVREVLTESAAIGAAMARQKANSKISGKAKIGKPKTVKAKSPLKPETPKKNSHKLDPITQDRAPSTEKSATTKPSSPPKKGWKWVRNAMNGAWVQEPEGTPFFASVSSETYWSS